MNRISIEFLTRPGCHLCADAEPVVRRAARWAGVGVGVESVDIDAHDHLVRDYGMRIPVVLVDGTVVAEGVVDGWRLWRRLVRLRR